MRRTMEGGREGGREEGVVLLDSDGERERERESSKEKKKGFFLNLMAKKVACV